MFDKQNARQKTHINRSLTTLQCFPNRPARHPFRSARRFQGSMHRHPPPIRVRSPTEMLVANLQRRRQQRIDQYHQIVREVRWLAFCRWRRANTPGTEPVDVHYPCPTPLCPSSGFPSQKCSLSVLPSSYPNRSHPKRLKTGNPSRKT